MNRIVQIFSVLTFGLVFGCLRETKAVIVKTGSEMGAPTADAPVQPIFIDTRHLVEAEEAAFRQEPDGSPGFAQYEQLLESDQHAASSFYAKEGWSLIRYFHLGAKPSAEIVDNPRYWGPYLAATFARGQWSEANRQRQPEGLWRQREYLAARLLLERIIADQSSGWRDLAMGVAAICDDYRTLERYRDIALAPKTARLLDHAAGPHMLDRDPIEKDVETYDRFVNGFCARLLADPMNGSDYYHLAFCRHGTLDATYVAEKRSKHSQFAHRKIQEPAMLAYTYSLRLASMMHDGYSQPHLALVAAEIARAHGLGDQKEKDAARQAIAIMAKENRWNWSTDSEFGTARQLIRLVAVWKLGEPDRAATCEKIFQRAPTTWYEDPVVLRACGGNVTEQELNQTRLRTEAATYLDPERLAQLSELPTEDLVRYARAKTQHCELMLPHACTMSSLTSCQVTDGIMWTYECGTTWLMVTAISSNPDQRQSAAQRALEFLRLDALKAKRQASDLRIPQDRSDNLELAAVALRRGLALIKAENLGTGQQKRFEQLLQELQK